MLRRFAGSSGFAVYLVLLSQLWLPFGLSAQGVNIEGAKKDGMVVVYGVVPPPTMVAVNKPFEKKYGIRVEYWRASTTQILERVLTEARAGRPRVDVIEGNIGTQLILEKEGFLISFFPPSTAEFPQQLLNKKSAQVPWRTNPISIVYNTELVKSDGVPKNFIELLQPKWTGKISFPDPSSHTTTAQFFVNMSKYNIDWRDFAKRIERQKPYLVTGFVQVMDAVVRGESLAGITYLKYVGAKKTPTDFVRLDKYLADVNTLALNRTAPHSNAGKLYMEFLCSLEGQKEMAGKGEFVVSPKVSPTFEGADTVPEKVVFMDVPSDEEFRNLGKEFREIFFSGR
jgi:iron(III) transport system substrate-binding protein